MKKSILSAAIVLLLMLIARLFKVDPMSALITMMAYWVFLDRLEKEDEK